MECVAALRRLGYVLPYFSDPKVVHELGQAYAERKLHIREKYHIHNDNLCPAGCDTPISLKEDVDIY